MLSDSLCIRVSELLFGIVLIKNNDLFKGRIKEILGSLSFEERIIVVRRAKGESFQSISEVLGVSVTTVRKKFRNVVSIVNKHNELMYDYVINGKDMSLRQFIKYNINYRGFVNLFNLPDSLLPSSIKSRVKFVNLENLLNYNRKEDLGTTMYRGVGEHYSEVIEEFQKDISVEDSQALSFRKFKPGCLYRVKLPYVYKDFLLSNYVSDIYHCRNWVFVCHKRDNNSYFMTDTYFKDKFILVDKVNEDLFEYICDPKEYRETRYFSDFECYDDEDKIGPIALDSGGWRIPKYLIRKDANKSVSKELEDLETQLKAIEAKRDSIISRIVALQLKKNKQKEESSETTKGCD